MKKIITEHSWYGCETGCCGYRVSFYEDDKIKHDHFWFDHFDTISEIFDAIDEEINRSGWLKDWKDVKIRDFQDMHCPEYNSEPIEDVLIESLI